jgi:hypothetical protein
MKLICAEKLHDHVVGRCCISRELIKNPEHVLYQEMLRIR